MAVPFRSFPPLTKKPKLATKRLPLSNAAHHWLQKNDVTATIIYLRPFEREDPGKQEAENLPDDPQDPPAKRASRDKKRIVRNPLPCGKKSRWKKRMDGKVVPRT
jgi:hypothetical protein